jgi:inorganic pyrophosphatase
VRVSRLPPVDRMRGAAPDIDWQQWQRLIDKRGVEIDRRKGTDHPRYPGWAYPLDYGFVPGTVGGDGKEIDVFCGSDESGLTAALVVRHDGQEEIKLLWNTTPTEIQAAFDFLADEMYVKIVRRCQ